MYGFSSMLRMALFKGTVSLIYKWPKQVSMQRPLLTHQALDIEKNINCPFKLIQIYKFLKCLMLNTFQFDASIMNVDGKSLCTF